MKINLIISFTFLNVTIRSLKITYVVHILFLLDSAALDNFI